LSGVAFPTGWTLEVLAKSHPRRKFRSGSEAVDRWLTQSALQSQKKHLTTTKVLLNEQQLIVGFYTLGTSQVEFSDLPPDVAKSLPRRTLPVAVLAWLGVDTVFQRRGIGRRLLATALNDCYDASETFAFVAVILDCIDESAKRFYSSFDFEALPGHPMRLALPFRLLEKLATQ
jgi:ribosomal protein S18 acetylase RimI-like enzyme